MHTRTNARGPRRAGAVALVGTTALAIIGGSLLSATAANADTMRCATTNGTTTLVDVNGSGSGLINLGSPGGVIGIATGANGAQIGLLSCTAVVGLGGTAPGTTVATLNAGSTTPVTVPTVSPSTPGTPGPTTPSATPTSSAPSTTAPAPTGAPTAGSTSSTKLSTVKVSTSSSTVYPAARGYSKSRVTFSVKGLTSTKGTVKITGKAVLKKGSKVVKTWKISSTTSKITWNGRIGKKVKAGVYTLTVTAWSADGTKKVTTMKVRVSAKHLVTRTISVPSKNLTGASTAALPAKVAKAFKYGKVTARVHYIAHVTGKARLVFANGATKRYVPLKDGTHSTKALPLPKGFGSVTIGHDWKKGDATLISLRSVFSYKQLV
ncbi:hypothetical protein [uncultured Amnibacterium sp.]|uniref:hypothetical protein n=1 Tax=uncultured Amnibacterium sp. TaxID=1631851 RepID=UPI0035CA1A36